MEKEGAVFHDHSTQKLQGIIKAVEECDDSFRLFGRHQFQQFGLSGLLFHKELIADDGHLSIPGIQLLFESGGHRVELLGADRFDGLRFPYDPLPFCRSQKLQTRPAWVILKVDGHRVGLDRFVLDCPPPSLLLLRDLFRFLLPRQLHFFLRVSRQFRAMYHPKSRISLFDVEKVSPFRFWDIPLFDDL